MGKEQWERLRGKDTITLPETAVQVRDVPLVLPGMQKIKKRTKDVRHQSLICQQNLSEVTNVFIRGQQFRDEQTKKEKLIIKNKKNDE